MKSLCGCTLYNVLTINIIGLKEKLKISKWRQQHFAMVFQSLKTNFDGLNPDPDLQLDPDPANFMDPVPQTSNVDLSQNFNFSFLLLINISKTPSQQF